MVPRFEPEQLSEREYCLSKWKTVGKEQNMFIWGESDGSHMDNIQHFRVTGLVEIAWAVSVEERSEDFEFWEV